MFRREAEAKVQARAQPLPVSTAEDSLQEMHEELNPAVIRWMPVAVPLSAALVLGVVGLVWWSVL
jgi:hypothetical protein